MVRTYGRDLLPHFNWEGIHSVIKPIRSEYGAFMGEFLISVCLHTPFLTQRISHTANQILQCSA
jgi:hypothetical protein